MEGKESRTEEISKWEARVAMSRHDRKRDMEVRLKLMRWYRNRFWPEGEDGMDEEDPGQRQVNYTSMLARTLQANLYAQDPTFSCRSPWNPAVLNSVFAATANNLPDHVGFRRVAHQCILDAVVGRYALAQVGFNATFGWDSATADKDRHRAQMEAEMFGHMDVPVKPSEDPQIHIQEHAAYKQILLQNAQAQGMPPPVETIGEIDAHIQKHVDAAQGERASVHEFPRDRRVWVSRVLPVRNGKIAFGWEYKAPFEEARWLWRTGITPLSELRDDPGMNTKGLLPNATLFEGPESEEAAFNALSSEVREAFAHDREMVKWTEVINRETGKRLVYAPGFDDWLYNERFEYADLFQASGYHKLALLMDPEYGAGKTPVEDAASAIITINNGEGKLYSVMSQSAPALVYLLNKVESTQVEKVQNRKIGEAIGIETTGGVDNLNDVMQEFSGARMPADNMVSMTRAAAAIGSDFGTGGPALGGSTEADSATAEHIESSSSSNVIGGLWGSNFEEWTGAIFGDALNVVKKYYDDETLLRVVGIERLGEWKQMAQHMKPDVEKLTVDSGSSLAGRVDKQRQDAMALLQAGGQSPLAKIRPHFEDLYKAFGKDPGRYMLTREEEAARAAEQQGPSPDMVGGPGEGPEAPKRPSEAKEQTPGGEFRSQVSERSAEAQRQA